MLYIGYLIIDCEKNTLTVKDWAKKGAHLRDIKFRRYEKPPFPHKFPFQLPSAPWVQRKRPP